MTETKKIEEMSATEIASEVSPEMAAELLVAQYGYVRATRLVDNINKRYHAQNSR